MFGEWYQKTNKTEHTNQCHTFFDCRRRAAIKERVTAVLRSILKEAFADSFQKVYERCQPCVVKDGDYFEPNKVNLLVSSVLFFWYHSPKVLDTPHICNISWQRVKCLPDDSYLYP
jgi:hypothetical protein